MTENMRETIQEALEAAYHLGYTKHAAGNMCYMNESLILAMMMDSIELAMMREERSNDTEISEEQEGPQFDDIEPGMIECNYCLCERCVTNECECAEDCYGVTCPDNKCVKSCSKFTEEE